MKESVRARWLEFTESFEGGCANLYQDVRGLVTIAFGNLCDSAGQAATLQLVHPDGTFATTAEKVSAWQRVKDDPKAAGLGWRYAAGLTDLRLTKEGMADIAYRKLAANESAARIRMPEWDTYPACAQMAMHSLFWACGPAAHFPRLFTAITARDWAVAAIEIQMATITPEGKKNAGLVPRNTANRVLMLNAQRVDSYKLDPELLEWQVLLGVDDAETQTELDNPASSPTIHVLHPDVTFEPHDPVDPDEAA